MTMADTAGPDVESLLAPFPPADYIQSYQPVPGEQVPPPYHELLVHEYHMTVTVEAHHGDLVDVKVLHVCRRGDAYARMILLALHGSGKIVQFGIMRINFLYCDEEVTKEIIAANKPLGRILIEHDVLRRIEPTAFLRIVPGPVMMKWFSLREPRTTYGRLALIHCNGQPAVELLEIVTPEG